MKHPNPTIEKLLQELASPKLATVDLSLERVVRLLDAIGNPHDKLPPVIHVAGTNGKGSLIAYLTAIFQQAGYRVHRYTSPHLVHFNEDIMLANAEIDDDKICDILKRVAGKAALHPVTFFEAVTCAAFLAFAETSADIVLLETGLGGRLDATNMVSKPAATVITPVSMDHMEFLGDTLTAIAGEKAGIIKSEVPCVVGPQEEAAVNVIEQKASEMRTKIYRAHQEWRVKETTDGFCYESPKRTGHFPFPNLIGKHQIMNAATAIAVLDCLKDFNIHHEHICEGITQAIWPARMQHITQGKLARLLPAQSELWLDGGHNPGAGQVIAEWIKQQAKPVHVICGMLRNKDIGGFLKPMAHYIHSLTSIPIEGRSDAQSPEAIGEIAARYGIKNMTANNAVEAIESIVNKEENDCIILICGSLYLAGNILWQNSN